MPPRNKVLVVGHVWPEPTSSAAGRRLLDLLDLLAAQDWEVHFACAAQQSEWSVDPAKICRGHSSHVIALNCSSFDQFVGDLAPDLVIFERFMTEEQFGWRVEDQCPAALRVLDTVDLHCLRDAREKRSKLPADSDLDLNSDLAKREIASILRCDLTLLISAAEIALLTQTFKLAPQLLHEFPFLTHEAGPLTAPPAANSFEERSGFVTIGNFRHAPNYDSVIWLHDTVWPLIRRQLPTARVDVWGSYMPKQAQRLHNPDQGFFVRGRAETVSHVMSEARVCLAPLRFGAGLKGKLLDAMEASTPSVTTSVGAESMFHELPWCGEIADHPNELAAAAVRLHEDELLWTTASQRCGALRHDRFDATRHGNELIARLNDCRAKLEERRRENFLGAMLRHHQHRSTEFMARWIEAKNRAT